MLKGILKYILVNLIVVTLGTASYAQSIPFTLEQFPQHEEKLKKAQRKLIQGDTHFEKGYYHSALDSYFEAYAFNANNAFLNYRIGLCYLNNIEHYKSLPYLEKAFLLKREVSTDIHLMLGKAYHVNSEFDKAINEFKAYLNLGKATEIQKQEINKYIAECETGKVFIKKDSRAFVDNMGVGINSAYDDHSPLITANAQMLIFTSSRENGRKKGADGHYDEDIYLSKRNKNAWMPVESFGEPVNTPFNDATIGLTPDGQQLLVFNGNKGNGDIQTCYLEGDQWNIPKNLARNINSEYRESSACYSADGAFLYFVSERPGGEGGKDIWVSKKLNDDNWGPPFNLGSTINTAYDEETVFLHPDGRTLYFSSKGHQNMGGFDIFVSYLNPDGKWSKPENMGHPINSPDDDLCFVISANGKYGYCSSIRPGGQGGLDIYKMTFLGNEKPLTFISDEMPISTQTLASTNYDIESAVELNSIRLTIVKGQVIDAKTKKGISAVIEIIDHNKNQVLFTTKTNSASGNYLVSLPSGKNYGILIKSHNYLTSSYNYNISGVNGYTEIDKTIQLAPIDKEQTFILNNIFFMPGTAQLTESSHLELDAVIEQLELQKELTFAIRPIGTGNALDNYLQDQRSKALIEYITDENIDSNRISIGEVIVSKQKNQSNSLAGHTKYQVKVTGF